MLNIVKVISTEVVNGFRRIKILRFGRGDVQTPTQATPFGFDSNPIANMRAIYGPTATNGKPVIIGYINTENLAAEGEMRLFSTNANGVQKAYVWLKNNGIAEINGNGDYAVKYNALSLSFAAYDAQINANLAAIAAAITGLGGTYVPTLVNADISTAKVDNVTLG